MSPGHHSKYDVSMKLVILDPHPMSAAVSIAQLPLPNDDASILPSILILLMQILHIIHCLFNLDKWPVTKTNQEFKR